MKINELTQKCVTVDGVSYRADFSFNAVLDACQILQETAMSEKDRQDLVLWLVCPDKIPSCKKPAVLAAYFNSLDGKQRPGEKVLDFEQDAGYIRAAFLQAYNVDLEVEIGRLSWWKFSELLSGIPSNTKLAEIIDIRTRPIPARTKTNGEYINALLRAKAACAIKSQANLQESLNRMFDAMKQMAGR